MDEDQTRKWVETDGLEDDASTVPTTGADKVAAAARDTYYWFLDGNLILVSQDVAFRIYKGVLAEHSHFFRSMFHEPAQALLVPEELVEGCRVVLLDDSPDDLRELFRLIFPLSTNLKFDGQTVNIAFISTIIRLGRKYEFDGLYEEAIRYLTAYYTTSFDAWDSDRHAALWQPKPIHAIRAINLARLTNTPSILPTAFYICATLGPDIVYGCPPEDGEDEPEEYLAPEDLHLVLQMKARLVEENARAAFLIFRFPGAPFCHNVNMGGAGHGARGCEGVWRWILEQAALMSAPHPVASERAMDSWMVNSPPISMMPMSWPAPPVAVDNGSAMPVQSALHRGPLCMGCWSHLLLCDMETRQKIWRRLPELAGLTIENWDGGIEL